MLAFAMHVLSHQGGKSLPRVELSTRRSEMMRPPETIEEELEIISQALEAGIDPFPPKKKPTRIAKLALGWFMIIMMVSWVSQLLYQYV
ncbi:MAG: hypothetical protein CND84_01935 [Marine Group II euryarchaeote MED-G35]|nr:MAG: hypothetical protein CND84_01935 [Marine Group II euryarchaeote MED-G35]